MSKYGDKLKKDFESFQKRHFKKVIKHTESLAREVLRQNPKLIEFVMAMGSAGFTFLNGDRIDESLDFLEAYDDVEPIEHWESLEAFNEFFEYWDNEYRISGFPMRFKNNGLTVTNW